MQILGLNITRSKAADMVTHLPDMRSQSIWAGLSGMIRESFAGAWQRGVVVNAEDVLTHPTVWACVTLIASDISKLRIKLVEQSRDGIWTEVDNPSYSPVLRKPNHYQTRIQFLEQWLFSRIIRGNAYILKEYNGSSKVSALYVLDPARVQTLVAPDGSVFYQLTTDYLSGIVDATVTVPASEIIHDHTAALFHQLVGLSGFMACGRAAMQGLKIQSNSEKFFENGSQPAGVLTGPNTISTDNAKRVQEYWQANFAGRSNIGKVAVLGDGLKYEPMAQTAVDSDLIKQLNWGDEKICSALHVPPYMVGVGPMPNYNNIEALNQQYYSQCLQHPIESIELLLDEGMGLAGDGFQQFGVELDVDEGLLRMDTATRVKAASDSLLGGMTHDEVRRRYHGLGKVDGGDTVYMQEQNWPLRLLADRELPTRQPTEPAALPPTETPKAFPHVALSLVTLKGISELNESRSASAQKYAHAA